MSERKLTPELQREAACLLQRFFERSLDDEDGLRLLTIWKHYPALKSEATENYEIEHLLHFRENIRRRPIRERTILDELSEIPGLSEFARLESTFTLPAPDTPETAKKADPAVSTAPKVTKPPLWLSPPAILSAAILIAVLNVYYLVRANRSDEFSADPRISARIDGSAQAVWDNGKTFLPKGKPLESGWLKLTDGLSQIRLRNDTSLIAQGPTELVLDESGGVVCKSGRLSVDVPPQKQPLRIGLPLFTVVVRGTKFSLDASANASEIHLLEGKVDIEYGSGQVQSLRSGESLIRTPAGETRRVAADASTFTSVDAMKSIVAEAERRQADDARRRRREFRNDPSVLLVLDATVLDTKGPGGSWAHCTTVPGRLPGTTAIGFRSRRSHLPVEVPATLTSMTLAAWVRVDRLGKEPAVLFGSHPYVSGSVQWKIEPSGTVKLLMPGGGANAPFKGAEMLKRSQWKVWTHLAAVVDGPNRTITHYLDGKAVRTETRPGLEPFRIGTALVGNGGPGIDSGKEKTSFLPGEIDELVIFNRALEPDEIGKLLQ